MTPWKKAPVDTKDIIVEMKMLIAIDKAAKSSKKQLIKDKDKKKC